MRPNGHLFAADPIGWSPGESGRPQQAGSAIAVGERAGEERSVQQVGGAGFGHEAGPAPRSVTTSSASLPLVATCAVCSRSNWWHPAEVAE